jgi:hypothetical protein
MLLSGASFNNEWASVLQAVWPLPEREAHLEATHAIAYASRAEERELPIASVLKSPISADSRSLTRCYWSAATVRDGRLSPASRPRASKMGPATKPLSCTRNGSASETLRVRLLSRPKSKQAPRIASGPSSPVSVGVPVQDSTRTPAMRQPMPVATLASKFSRKMNHAIRGSGDALKGQQQGCGGRIGHGQARHKKQRTDHAACQYGGCEPWQLAAP